MIGLGEDPLDRPCSPLSVRARSEGAEGVGQVVERHGRNDAGAVGLGDDPVLGSLAPRRGVIGRGEGLDVAQFSDPRLKNRGGRVGSHSRGQGDHALHLRALFGFRVVTAHA